jgi:hypothetical protein
VNAKYQMRGLRGSLKSEFCGKHALLVQFISVNPQRWLIVSENAMFAPT